MPLDPTRLLVLRAVHREGGVGPAAETLHLTASAVSQHLRKLEAEAGTDLVDRTQRGGRRPVELTPAGEALALQAGRIADELGQAERTLDRFRDRSRRTVRIGGFASVFEQLVTRTVLSLTTSDPTLEPHLMEVTDEEGVELLGTGDLDVLLSERLTEAHDRRPSGLLESDLRRDPFTIIVPAGWPHGLSVDELLTRDWVLSTDHNAARQSVERIAADHGVTIAPAHEAYEASTMVSLVSAGLGAAIVPQSALASASPRRVRTFSHIEDPGSRMLTVLHTDSDQPTGVRRFLQELRWQASAIPAEASS